MKRLIAAAALTAFAPAIAQAQAVVTVDRYTFIEQTLLAVFYHELGHGILDLLELPMYGPNEPSGDIASVMLVDYLYDEDRGIEMMTNAANLFAAEGIDRGEDQLSEFWDTHGSDQGRFCNTICVYYGGNTEGRQDMADTLGLPEWRAERCEGEYDDASRSWGVVIDGMAELSGNETFVLTGTDENAPFTNAVMIAEVEALNNDLGLEMTVPISIEPCGEPNAYYSSETKSIVMCTEFEGYLGQMYDLIAQ